MRLSSQYRAAGAIVLLLFIIQALSPVCMTVFPGEGNASARCRRDDTKVKVGIVWLKTFLTVLTGCDPDDTDGDGLLDGDQVLVAKEQALARAHPRIKPCLEAWYRLLSMPERLPVLAPEYEVPKDMRHLESDGYASLNVGLSPPELFS